MGLQITVKVKDPKKIKNIRNLAQELAQIVESITKTRTTINVKLMSYGAPNRTIK